MSLCRVALFAALLPVTAVAESYVPGSPVDPRVREAGFLMADGHYLDASILLGRMSAGDQPGSHQSDHFLRPYADALVGFGMREQAGAVIAQISEKTATQDVVRHALLKSAEFDYQHGRYDSAARQLDSLRKGLPPELLSDWQSLYARVLISQGRFADAVAVLPAIDDPQITPYMLFNLGIARINLGQVREGREALDRVGQMKTLDGEMLSLRDKANLVLGYSYLRTIDGHAAIPVFERVRQEGPFSNRALLGLGWAEIAQEAQREQQTQPAAKGNGQPDGTATASTDATPTIPHNVLPQREAEADFYRRANLKPIELPPGAGGEAASLKRAMVSWVELIGRDPMDPSVQEGALAIPYSLEKLGARTQAELYYTHAIELLEASLRTFDQAIGEVRNGHMLDEITRGDADQDSGWMWRLKQLPDTSGSFYLRDLIGEIPFQEALKNYRDARLLSRSLDSWKARLNARHNDATASALHRADDSARLTGRIDGLRPQVNGAAVMARRQIEDMALNELQLQRKITETYIVAARLALARLYDDAGPEPHQ